MKRYVLLMACAAMIAACQTPTEEENQEDPTPVPEEEVTETQIPEEGGTVTEGDISVDIPQGTFTAVGPLLWFRRRREARWEQGRRCRTTTKSP